MKREYSVIAFDLDGTLTDPKAGLIAGFVYAFKKLSIPYESEESLTRFIGPPLWEAWKNEFGFTDEETERAILTFREYYNVYGWWDNRIYPGISELLSSLKARGKTLVVATSKPEDTAKKVLHLFGIDKYFDFIGGADGHKKRDKKEEVIKYSLDAVGATDPRGVLMVGDRCFDALGARAFGVDSVGVLWGHGTEEEIRASGFNYIISEPQELLSIV